MRYSLIIIAFICCFSCQEKQDLPVVVELHDNWQFKKVSDSIWHSAAVPGNVHSDLLNNELIEHPFIGNNEEELQWISESDWEYRLSFKLDNKTLRKEHIELSFEGLDTYASVFLNDSLILKTNNAFRTFNVEVKPLVKTTNTLRIVFEKTSKTEEKEKEKLGYHLPERNRVFTRKAQFQYGWDWGPKLNTSGIWKAVKLKAWNDFKIRDLYLNQILLTDTTATLQLELNHENLKKKNLDLELYVNDSMYVKEQFNNRFSFKNTFEIKNPKWWWPHNLGEPYMYSFKAVVKHGSKVLDSMSLKKGLRTVGLVTQKDSLGETFYFEVNRIPVYMKGANYIPQNSMQNKVTDKHYDDLLDDAVNANMNMLRVWGGGIYENDIFYELCDQKGIMVWQDFMFACAMYPGDSDFLENVSIEAEQQVKRLRNHASIALWCGNNENSEGWHRWGWQSGRSDEEKTEIWNNYLKVFDSILPKTVDELTDITYWESSPKYGRGNPKYKFEGDAHDWWIWHDAYPFEHLEEQVPRFMSEFGFQSYPSYEAIKYINQSDTVDITSDEFRSHQKHARGFQLIEDYMRRDFPVPVHPEDYVYMSQLVQAYGITKGIEAQRRAKPYNMGTLYWQLNDCWPVVSWSSIDFFGNWKALHYKAKRSFEDLLISSELKDDILKVYIVNDNNDGYTEELDIKVLDFDGKEIYNHSKRIFVSSLESTIEHEMDLKKLQTPKDEVVVVATFEGSKSLFYLAKPKDLKLKKAPIQKTITKIEDGFKIEISSTTFQKDVFLFCNEKGHFSDNYFDMLPNETKTIEFVTNAESLDDLSIKTFNNFIR